MNTRKAFLLLATVAVAIALAHSSPVSVAAGEDAVSASALPVPETKSDYTTLAGEYDELAKAAQAEAEKHRKMAASSRGGMKMAYLEQMKGHCADIVQLQEKLAEEYTGLAAAYRAQAAEMGD